MAMKSVSWNCACIRPLLANLVTYITYPYTVLLRCNVTHARVYFLLYSRVLRTTHLTSSRAHAKRIARMEVLRYVQVILVVCNAHMQTHYPRALKDLNISNDYIVCAITIKDNNIHDYRQMHGLLTNNTKNLQYICILFKLSAVLWSFLLSIANTAEIQITCAL